jgi:hypothetical protein
MQPYPYQLVIHYIDLTLDAMPLTLSYYSNVERSWPSVPSAGETVSIGGEAIADVAFVEYKEDRVRLHFNLDSSDTTSTELESLGFKRPAL